MSSPSIGQQISVRPMIEADLPEVRRIFRVAFATFVGAPDPENFWADREYIFTRWRANPAAALAADADGTLAGSNFVTQWGSVGFFGPLTIRPELWNQRIAQHLLAPTMALFEKWGVREAGLFTFPHSAKHIGLYQKFGFWPRFLTALMSKSVAPLQMSATAYSTLNQPDQTEAQAACRKLTDSIYDGLDVTSEIRSVQQQNLGETLLLWGGDSLEAFAVMHCGEGTEAGRDHCYIKFAAVRPGANAASSFDHLMDSCEALAAQRGLQSIDAGVNFSRSDAYHRMQQRGFRTQAQGVTMHRPNGPAYNREDVYILDDWR